MASVLLNNPLQTILASQVCLSWTLKFLNSRLCVCVCVCVQHAFENHMWVVKKHEQYADIYSLAFSALMLFVGCQEGHSACKKQSGGVSACSVWERCRFAYIPADTTATHCLLLQ